MATERTLTNPLSQLEQEPSATSGVQIWRALLHYKWLVVLCTLIGTGLGYLYYRRQPVIYSSSGRILLLKDEVESPVPLQRSRAFYEDSIATQMVLLRSPAVIRNAAEKYDLKSLEMFGGGDPTGAIAGRLGISQSGTSNILDISFAGNNAGDCPIVINAVIASYEEFLNESHQNVGVETVRLINQAKETLLKELDKKEKAYREFRLTAPLIWTRDGTINVHQQRLSSIEGARSGLILTRSQTKAQLEAIEAALKRGGNREAILLMMHQSTSNDMAGGGTSTRAGVAGQLFPMLLEEQMMLEEYGPDHPKIRNLRKKINFTRNHLQSMGLEEKEVDGEPKNLAKPIDFLTVYLESLREDLKAIDVKEQQLDELFVVEEKEARRLGSFEVEDDSMRRDITRTNQLFEGIVKRLEEISLLQDYGKLKTRVLSPAGTGYQVAPVMSRIVGLGVALGFFAGCGFVFLIELADKRFRSPEEVSETLGLPVIGHVPYSHSTKVDETSPIDASVCVFHQPKSSLAEAHRGVRTALYFSTRGEGHKVIQVSSPNPGDGKSTLAVNLAVAIAQSGKRILLMESDFRKPRVHRLLGLEREVGVTSVISGESELSDSIQETAIENLFALTCGPKPTNPSELLSSRRYAELIELLREKFEYVIIDTPPLMVVTDPSVVAPRVDGILLTVKISKRSRQDCVQSAELLKSLNANVLGVVINGQRTKSGYGYGYAGYGHKGYIYQDSHYYPGSYGGYGYGGYGYGGYGYGEAYSSYYDDEDGTKKKRTKVEKSPKRLLPPKGTA